MTELVAFRPAKAQDFAFCQRIYFDGMGWMIERLQLDMERQYEGFVDQWKAGEVRVIVVACEDAGWLQVTPADDIIFLGQLFLAKPYQGQGIGRYVVQFLIEEAKEARKAITLGVVKINPARGFYERLGFSVTHEDQYKVYMRHEPDISD